MMESPLRSVNFTRCLHLSIGFFALFVAFNSAQAMSTTLNSSKGLGYSSLAALYLFFTLGSIVAPKIVELVGPRAAMCCGSSPYVLMVLSYLHPTPALVMIVFSLVGLGAAILWTGQGVYLGRLALLESKEKKLDREQTSSRFNFIFFAFFQGNGMTGMILCSTFLSAGANTDVLFGVLAVVCGIGIVVLALLGQALPVELHETSEEETVELLSNKQRVGFMETLTLANRDLKMKLMVPIIFYNGMSLAFMFGDYTGTATVNSLTKSWDGYVLATFYGVNALVCILYSKLVKRITRRASMGISGLIQVLFFIFFLIFYAIPVNPGGTSQPLPYLILFFWAGMFGAGDAVFESQPIAILQTFYKDSEVDRNASMSGAKLFQSLGFATQFFLGWALDAGDPHVKNDRFRIKALILMLMLLLGSACLYWLDSKVQSLDGRLDKDSAASSPLLGEGGDGKGRERIV